jgi:uncharacterized membrane protein YeiH
MIGSIIGQDGKAAGSSMQIPGLATAQIAVEVAATAAFAISGVLVAARKRLDAVGVIVVAGLTAFGGGTLRDVLLDRRPFFWVEHWLYVVGVALLASGAMLWMRGRHFKPTERALLWPDALGLGLFAGTGTQLALAGALPPLVAVLLGVVTAVCGGVLRDIVCNEIPAAFSDHRPYALCAFAGGWAVVGAEALGLDQASGLAAATAVTVALRVLAVRHDWRLPGWQME